MTAPQMGLEKTFGVLTDSVSPLANGVLLAAMDSPYPSVVEQAVRGLLRRPELAGRRAILQRWETLDPRLKPLLRELPSQMEGAIREAVSNSEMGVCARGCDAAVYLEEYSIIPTLVTQLSNQVTPTADTLAATTLLLADRLSQALATPRQAGLRRDPQMARAHVVESLESAMQRYTRHRRREVVEAYLILARADDRVLRHIIQDPHHGSFVIVIDVLQKSLRPAITRLLLELLNSEQAPSAALNVIGHRSDLGFLRAFLRQVVRAPAAVRQSLKRLSGLTWLKSLATYLPELDEAAQEGLLLLAKHAGISRTEAFMIVELVLQHGRPGARRVAAAALADFKGHEANHLALSALQDPDPEVQTALVGQLRSRGITGLFPRLVELLDSPHLAVRQAARQNLDEFSFRQYLAAFDILEDDVRLRTGALVKKVDPQTVPLLEAELLSGVRTRQMRGLRIARALQLVETVEGALLPLLEHSDARLRTEVVTLLAASQSPASLAALRQASGDPHHLVQEAARQSLMARSSGVPWPSAFTTPPTSDLFPATGASV